MQKLISTLAVLTFAGTLLAQSPFVGTWKLDTAKTKYTAGDPPKDVTLVIEEQGENLQLAATGSYADGSPISVKYTIPTKGGVAQVQAGPHDAITSKTVGPNVRENSYSKDGKQVASRRIVISKDGKTMRATIKGMNAAGQTVAGTETYQKQ